MAGKVPEYVLAQGNRNNAPSDIILKKISSENMKRKDIDADLNIFMEKLGAQYKKDPKYQGQHITSFIQELSVSQFYVLMYTERVLKYVIEMSKKGYFAVYLDGTGTIISAPNNQNRPYYYAVLLQSSTLETGHIKPALPIMELISTVHNVPFLTMALTTLADALKTLNKSKELVLHNVEMDFSRGEIQSTLKAFNDMTISQYINFVWEALLENYLNRISSFIVVHVCSSHILVEAKRTVRKITKNDQIRIYACNVITAIIHATDLGTAASILKHAVVLFETEFQQQNVKESMTFITKFSEGTNELEKNLPEIENIENEMKIDKWKCQTQRKQSPFYIYFNKVYESIKPIKLSYLKKMQVKLVFFYKKDRIWS